MGWWDGPEHNSPRVSDARFNIIKYVTLFIKFCNRYIVLFLDFLARLSVVSCGHRHVLASPTQVGGPASLPPSTLGKSGPLERGSEVAAAVPHCASAFASWHGTGGGSGGGVSNAAVFGGVVFVCTHVLHVKLGAGYVGKFRWTSYYSNYIIIQSMYIWAYICIS